MPSRTSTLAAVALIGCALTAASPAPAAADARPAGAWLRPVPGRVVRGFQPPLTRFGRGHLGVDLAAAPGTGVRVAGPGRVVFAGAVAGALHVVVLHGAGVRTSYSFLASVRVRFGQTVGPGAVLGTTGGRGRNHDGGVLHLGLRIGGGFVDPMQLFGAAGPGARVHLVVFDPAGVRAASDRTRAGPGAVGDRVGDEGRALALALAEPAAVTTGAVRLDPTTRPPHRAPACRRAAFGCGWPA